LSDSERISKRFEIVKPDVHRARFPRIKALSLMTGALVTGGRAVVEIFYAKAARSVLLSTEGLEDRLARRRHRARGPFLLTRSRGPFLLIEDESHDVYRKTSQSTERPSGAR
jgi:hypothetical protein